MEKAEKALVGVDANEMTAAQAKKAMAMFDGYENTGYEEFDEDSVAIPRLKILQKGSPEVDEDSGDYVDGAKVGDVINTVTKKLYRKDQPMVVIPCHFTPRFNVWVPREEGGGLVTSLNAAEGKQLVLECEKDERGIPHTKEGHQVIDTREHYFLVLEPDGTPEAVVSSFTSTKVKKSKQWNTIQKLVRMPGAKVGKALPCFAFAYEMKTVLETKDQYTYYNWEIKPLYPVPTLPNGGDLIEIAIAFHDAVVSGDRVAVPEDEAPFRGNDNSDQY